MKRRTIGTVAIVALLASGAAQAQTLVLSDTFDVPTGTGQEFDLQVNQAARQAGGAIGVTYSNASANISAPTQVYLSQTEDGFSASGTGVLVMRALPNAEGGHAIGAASAKINEDLAPSLAGNHYTISYTGLLTDRTGVVVNNPTNLNSWYQSITLSGGAGNPGEPNMSGADLGFMMHSDGTAQVWGDGVLLDSIVVTGFALNQTYDVLLDIDESHSIATISVDVAGNVTRLGGGLSFEGGETARRLQFYNRISTDGLPANPNGFDAIIDGQVNDLEISTVNSSVTKEYVFFDDFNADDFPNANHESEHLTRSPDSPSIIGHCKTDECR